MYKSIFGMKRGVKILISEFAETPLEGVDRYLSIEPQDYPDINTLNTSDLVIGVKSAALGWVDLLMTSGQYQHQPPLPYTPGLEYCGEVLWKGKDVSDEKAEIGDKVLVDGFISGPRSPGKYQEFGGFATYAVAPLEAIIKIPKRLDYDQACNLLGSYETAYHCLITCGDLQVGETVLIHGASGATGLAAVHIAKLLGATIIATGRSDEKLDIVKEQGADYIINTTSEDPNKPISRFRDQVKSLTQGKGVDVVYDGVGGPVSEESMRCVSFGARFLIVGWAATPFVARGKGKRGAPNVNKIPTNLIMMKGLKVLGCPSVIAAQHNPAIRTQRLRAILNWVEEGRVTPYVSKTYALDDIKEAMQDKWNGKIVGGAAVRP